MQAPTAGSTLWQTVFLSFAGILLLLEVIRGYRLGLPRQLMRGAAVIAAYAAAYFGGDLLVPLLRPILNWPDFVLSMLGGALLALIVYGVIGSLGTILFKRTAQHSAGTVRLVYGLSGAATGIVFGLFFIWLILVGIRSVGAIADAQVQARPKPEAPAAKLPGERPLPLENFDADTLTSFLARLKNSVELGSVGEVLKKSDVTSPALVPNLEGCRDGLRESRERPAVPFVSRGSRVERTSQDRGPAKRPRNRRIDPARPNRRSPAKPPPPRSCERSDAGRESEAVRYPESARVRREEK